MLGGEGIGGVDVVDAHSINSQVGSGVFECLGVHDAEQARIELIGHLHTCRRHALELQGELPHGELGTIGESLVTDWLTAIPGHFGHLVCVGPGGRLCLRRQHGTVEIGAHFVGVHLLVVLDVLGVLGHPAGVVLGVVKNTYCVRGIRGGNAVYLLTLVVIVVELQREDRRTLSFSLGARASSKCVTQTRRSILGVRIAVAVFHHQRAGVQLVVILLIDIYAGQGVRHLGLGQARLGHIEGRGPGNLLDRHLRCGFLQVSRRAGADTRGARAGLTMVVAHVIGHRSICQLARRVNGGVVAKDVLIGLGVDGRHRIGVGRTGGLCQRISAHQRVSVINFNGDGTRVLHDVPGALTDRVRDGATGHGRLGLLVVSDGPRNGLHVSLARRLACGLGQARVVDVVTEVLAVLTGRVIPITLDGNTILGLLDRTLTRQLAVVNGSRILQDHLLAVGHLGDGVGKAVALIGRRTGCGRGPDVLVVGQRRTGDGVSHDYVLIGARRRDGHLVVHLAVVGAVPALFFHRDIMSGIDGDGLFDVMAEVQTRHIRAELTAELQVKLDVVRLGELLEVGIALVPLEGHLAVGTDGEGVVPDRDGLLRSVCIRVLDSYVDVRAVGIRLKSGGQLIGKVAVHIELGVFTLREGDLDLIVLPRFHCPGAVAVPSSIVRRQRCARGKARQIRGCRRCPRIPGD